MSNLYVGVYAPTEDGEHEFTILREVDQNQFSAHPDSAPPEVCEAIKTAMMLGKALKRDFGYDADFAIFPYITPTGEPKFGADLLRLNAEQKEELGPAQSMLLVGCFVAAEASCDILTQEWDMSISREVEDDGVVKVSVMINNDPTGDIKDYTKSVMRFKVVGDKEDLEYLGSWDIEEKKFKGGKDDGEVEKER